MPFNLNNVRTGVQFAAIGYSAYRAAKERAWGKRFRRIGSYRIFGGEGHSKSVEQLIIFLLFLPQLYLLSLQLGQQYLRMSRLRPCSPICDWFLR